MAADSEFYCLQLNDGWQLPGKTWLAAASSWAPWMLCTEHANGCPQAHLLYAVGIKHRKKAISTRAPFSILEPTICKPWAYTMAGGTTTMVIDAIHAHACTDLHHGMWHTDIHTKYARRTFLPLTLWFRCHASAVQSRHTGAVSA